MSVVIFLRCNGEGCDLVLPVDAEDVISARLEARLKGWDTARHYETQGGRWTTADYCGPHVLPRVGGVGNSPADIAVRVLPQDCAQGGQCPSRHTEKPEFQDLFDWCGHDQLGHRMANILIRDRWETVKQVTAATEADLLDLRGFGRMCLERWIVFRKMDADA